MLRPRTIRCSAAAPPTRSSHQIYAEPLILLLLGLTGLVAGFVDAIAGGGGMISLPVLLSVGLPPVAALGTQKMQAIVGTAMAAVTYWRRGFVSLRSLVPALAASFAGAFTGALVVKHLDISLLSVAVPVALIAIAGYFLFAPRLTDEDKAARLGFAAFVPLLALGIGFYDGIFGPGTGSFFTMAFVLLFGLGVTRAAAHTKVLNSFTNLGALVFFLFTGDVVWPVALVMIVGQVIGGYVGARTGIRFGVRLIRPLIVVISIALALRLILVR